MEEYYIGKMEEYERVNNYRCSDIFHQSVPFFHWLEVRKWLHETTVYTKGLAVKPYHYETNDEFEKKVMDALLNFSDKPVTKIKAIKHQQ